MKENLTEAWTLKFNLEMQEKSLRWRYTDEGIIN